jgi:hypothetical protein
MMDNEEIGGATSTCLFDNGIKSSSLLSIFHRQDHLNWLALWHRLAVSGVAQSSIAAEYSYSR